MGGENLPLAWNDYLVSLLLSIGTKRAKLNVYYKGREHLDSFAPLLLPYPQIISFNSVEDLLKWDRKEIRTVCSAYICQYITLPITAPHSGFFIMFWA